VSKFFDENKVLWAVCQSDQILRQSFNPLRGWLLRYFKIKANFSLEERRIAFDFKLDDLLASVRDPGLANELDRVRSVLAALVDIYWADSLYEQLDAEGRYNNTFLALIVLLKAESLRQPVILLLEDLHFTDDDTKSFLPRLRRSILADDEYPVAIFVTSRPHAVVLDSLDSSIIDSRIDLSGLPVEAVGRYVETLLGGSASQRLISLVMKRSEGNPYFVEQIIRYLQEESFLEMSGEGWTFVNRVRDSFLPGDIHAVLIARLDQLTREVRNVVHTASVLGRDFEVRALVLMLRSDEDVHKYISEAEQAAIWAPLNEIRYIFSHGLLRDAAYSMQMRARRRELHKLAVEALEQLYADSLRVRYAELAYHAEHANLTEKTQKYYTLAGQEAASLFQNSQAVDYFTRALASTPLDDFAARYELIFQRAGLFSLMGKRDLQLKDFETLEEWATQLTDKDRIARVQMLRSAYYYFIGRYQEAIEYAKLAEMGSDALADTEMALYTHVVWTVSLFRLGYLEEAMAHGKETLAHDRRVENKKEVSRILSTIGWVALDQARPDIAREYLLEALEIAREIKDPSLEVRALGHLALLEGSVNGNYALARQYQETCYDITRKLGDRFSETAALVNLGFTAGMQGDFDAARSYHERTLAITKETGDINQEALVLVNLSAVIGHQGENELALKHAQRAKELAETTLDRSNQAWAELYLGHAYLKMNEVDAAESAYRNSIGLRSDLKQMALSMEPLGGLVEVYLQKDDLVSASKETEKILDFIMNGSNLDGTDEPLRVYYACYQLLERKGDPRSEQVLRLAKSLLEKQVSNYKDENERKRYIESIPWRRTIWEKYDV